MATGKVKLDRYGGGVDQNHHSLPVPSSTTLNTPLLIAMPDLLPALSLTDEGGDQNLAGFATCATPMNNQAYRLLVNANTGTVVSGTLIYHDNTTTYDEDAGTTPLKTEPTGNDLWGRVLAVGEALATVLVANAASGFVAVVVGGYGAQVA